MGTTNMKAFKVILIMGSVAFFTGSITLVGVTTSPAYAQQCPNGNCP